MERALRRTILAGALFSAIACGGNDSQPPDDDPPTTYDDPLVVVGDTIPTDSEVLQTEELIFADERLYACSSTGVVVWDVATKTSPTRLFTLDGAGACQHLALHGSQLQRTGRYR